MAKRNWKQLKKEWVAEGCPPLKQFFEKRGIPLGTGYKVARRHEWAKTGQLVDSETESQFIQKEAMRSAAFRDRLMIIGKAIQEEALNHLRITPDNALEALRLGAKLEEVGTYGPAGLRGGESIPLAVQSNTIVYQQVLQIVQTTGSKQRKLLGAALKRLHPSGKAKTSG